ncbi:MBL fold metallo-hydrolase [Cupriavidus metallidurans]|nr:MBL fold metallo-hydrolase [Cupriavidus metallidurans]
MARATVRTYRHGLGDCHLVSLHRADGQPYYILIDCGVILGTPDAKAKMTSVIENVRDETSNHIDLLVATHEHWDHLSGFVQAADAFSGLSVDHVWMAWTENPADPDAMKLLADRQHALAMLRDASLRVQSTGSGELPLFHSLTEFFGTATRTTTS